MFFIVYCMTLLRQRMIVYPIFLTMSNILKGVFLCNLTKKHPFLNGYNFVTIVFKELYVKKCQNYWQTPQIYQFHPLTTTPLYIVYRKNFIHIIEGCMHFFNTRSVFPIPRLPGGKHIKLKVENGKLKKHPPYFHGRCLKISI